MAQMEHIPWKRLTNPDYLGAYSLDDGTDLIAVIDYIKNEVVTGANGKKETCVVAHFKPPVAKPMILNKTNLKSIEKLYHTPYIDEWHGRAIQLFVDHNVRFGGETVDALRVRPFIPKVAVPKQTTYKCGCGAEITAFGKLNAAQMAQYTQDKYGKALCTECAKKAAEDKTKDAENSELTEALQEDDE